MKPKYVYNTGSKMIETEGREPIFSPKDTNGNRRLLYYNPNDPTHKQGGVNAIVTTKAQYKKKTNEAGVKSVTKYGYKNNSPYKNRASNLIESSTITMKGVSKDIKGIGLDNNNNPTGEVKDMKANNKSLYTYKSKKVLEIPEGSSIVTANNGDNKKALQAYKNGDKKLLEKIIDKMPEDTEENKKQDGVNDMSPPSPTVDNSQYIGKSGLYEYYLDPTTNEYSFINKGKTGTGVKTKFDPNTAVGKASIAKIETENMPEITKVKAVVVQPPNTNVPLPTGTAAVAANTVSNIQQGIAKPTVSGARQYEPFSVNTDMGGKGVIAPAPTSGSVPTGTAPTTTTQTPEDVNRFGKVAGQVGGLITKAATYAPAAYNLGKGLFEPAYKETRRYYNPKYSEFKSNLPALEAQIGREALTQRKNLMGAGSASTINANLAQIAQAKNAASQNAIISEKQREIANRNANTALANEAQFTNIGKADVYDALDLQNKARKNDFTASAMKNISDIAQSGELRKGQERRDKFISRNLGTGNTIFNPDTNETLVKVEKDGQTLWAGEGGKRLYKFDDNAFTFTEQKKNGAKNLKYKYKK